MTHGQYFNSSEFRETAEASFSFLNERGFVGPLWEDEDDEVVFTSARLGVRVIYNGASGELVTVLDGERHRASLSCLYVEAGLGPAQHIREIARTGNTLRTALDSQANALERLLPRLDEPDGADLLRRCHRR